MMQNKKIAGKTILYFANAIISAALGLLTTKIFSMYVDPTSYGIYSLVFQIYSLIVSLVFMIFSQSILRLYNQYEKENKLEILFNTYFVCYAFVFFVFIALCAIGIPLLCVFCKNNLYTILIILFAAMFMIDGVYNIQMSILRIKLKAFKELVGITTQSVIKIIVFLLCFFVFKLGVSSIVVGFICGFVFIVLFCVNEIKLKRPIYKYYSKDTLKDILSFGLPLIGLPIINWALSYSDQLMIVGFCGQYNQGIYSMGYHVSYGIFSVLTSFLITAGHPQIVRIYEEENGKENATKYVRSLSVVYFLICIPALAAFTAYGDLFINFFASNKYSESVLTCSAASYGFVFAGYINYANKPWELTYNSKRITIYSLIGALLNIVLNAIFLPFFGYNAAAFTTVASYALVCVLSLIGSRKIMKVRLSFLKYLMLVGVLAISVGFLFLTKFFYPKSYFSGYLGLIFYLMLYLFGLFLFFTLKSKKEKQHENII